MLHWLRKGNLFACVERRFDVDGEFLSFRELETKLRGRPESLVLVRWAEAKSHTIAMSPRLTTFERKLLAPINWAVVRRQDPSDFKDRMVYYDRTTDEMAATSLPERLGRMKRYRISGSGPELVVPVQSWDPRPHTFLRWRSRAAQWRLVWSTMVVVFRGTAHHQPEGI